MKLSPALATGVLAALLASCGAGSEHVHLEFVHAGDAPAAEALEAFYLRFQAWEKTHREADVEALHSWLFRLGVESGPEAFLHHPPVDT